MDPCALFIKITVEKLKTFDKSTVGHLTIKFTRTASELLKNKTKII
jgi:hypothetical protein